MFFGTRIDLRVRPTEDFNRFLVALQCDVHGSAHHGVALQLQYNTAVQELECTALVGNQVIRSVVSNVRREMFEDRFFVLTIATHPSGFKIYVDSIYLTEQRHFMDVTSINFLRIDGDLVVYCAEVNNNFSNKHLLPVQDIPEDRGRVFEIPPMEEPESESRLANPRLTDPRTTPRMSTGTIEIPADYTELMDELDQQSHLIDEEIRTMNERPVSRDRGFTRYEAKPLEIPSADTSENEDLELPSTDQKGKKRVKKSRFETFMKKIKKKSRKKPESRDQVVLDTSESEFSTDFENYLMGSDSEVSSRASPTEILQQMDDEDLLNIAKERLEQKERERLHMEELKLASEDPRTKYFYNISGKGDEAIAVPLSEVFESPGAENKTGKVAVRTQDGRVVEIERTKLRISTQVVGEGEGVLSESMSECRAEPTPDGGVQYHVIHHHVHHHLGDEDEHSPYHKEIPPPKYEDDYIDPNAGRPSNQSRMSLLCCYGV